MCESYYAQHTNYLLFSTWTPEASDQLQVYRDRNKQTFKDHVWQDGENNLSKCYWVVHKVGAACRC